MKLLLLTKRFGSGKDHILEDFGRQVRLAQYLAKADNEVHMIAADYTKKQSFSKELHKMKVFVYPLSLFSIINFMKKLRNKIKKEKYDAIIASGDPIFGIMAYFSNKKIPIIYDLQDNFEEYKAYRIPSIKYFDRKVLKKSKLVIVVSNSLGKVAEKFNKKIAMITNGVDLNKIKVLNKNKARKKLRLSLKAKIIGYAGRYEGRGQKEGIDLLIQAFQKFKKQNNNAYLLLIGDGNTLRINKEKDKNRIIVRESVSHEKLMEFLSAADILVIAHIQSEFTKYMYSPYKLSEYMVFSKPIVCSDVGEMKSLFNSKLIFKQNNIQDLIEKLKIAMNINKINYSKQLKKLNWEYLAKKLDKEIRKAIK